MNRDEYKKMEEYQSHHWWYRGRRSLVQMLFRHYTGPRHSEISLLDIGCGNGEAGAIVGNPSRLVGIDTSLDALELAKGKGYKSLHKINQEHLEFSDNSFEGVLMLDVLEHVEADLELLRECYRVLVLGGILVLTVPAYPWLWSGHDEVFGHKRRYNRRDLLGKITKARFTVRCSSHYVTFLFPFVLVFRLVEGRLLKKQRSHFFTLWPMVNTILLTVQQIESWLISLGIRFPFGSSIVVIAHKPHHPL